MRGESRGAAKPRAKAPANSKSSPRARKPGASYAPGKLGAVRGAGLSPWGALLAAKQARLPSTYMFRTGGDTTVRGYGYRKIGIDFGDDLIGPGRYMAVGSVEWQRPILQDRFPGLLQHTWAAWPTTSVTCVPTGAWARACG